MLNLVGVLLTMLIAATAVASAIDQSFLAAPIMALTV